MTGPDVRCIFCNEPAVAVYWMERGCAARPGWRLQALCLQHESKAEPILGMEIVRDLRVEQKP